MNCPKCGAKTKCDWRYTAMDQWSCGTCEPVGYAIQESHACLRNQLATVTAERDAARAELKEQLVVRYIACEPEIYIEPHSNRDREMLERLEANCITKGCGRHCDTGKLLHVRIALEPVISVFPDSRTEL